MQAVIRRYTGASALIDEIARQPQAIEQLLSSTPGFVAYHAVRAGDTLVTISVCRDRAGTEETTRRAATWVRENLPAGSVAAPEITDGEAFLSFSAQQAAGTGSMRS